MGLPGPIVMKFGGTSVADADAIAPRRRDRRGRARQPRTCRPVVIVSAMSGVTDRLLELAAAARAGDAMRTCSTASRPVAAAFRSRRAATAAEFATDVLAEIGAAARRSPRAAEGARDPARASPRSLDAIAATGEMMSSRIVAAALSQRARRRLGRRAPRRSSRTASTPRPLRSPRDARGAAREFVPLSPRGACPSSAGSSAPRATA